MDIPGGSFLSGYYPDKRSLVLNWKANMYKSNPEKSCDLSIMFIIVEYELVSCKLQNFGQKSVC